MRRMTVLRVLLLIVTLSPGSIPAAAQGGPAVDLSAIKTFAADNTAHLVEHAAHTLRITQAYYDAVAAHQFDHEAAFAADPKGLAQTIFSAREAWLEASVYYETVEGIVAGTPSLSVFDVLIDAGPSAEEDPEGALDWTLILPDGTELHSPGNLFHTLSEPALYGTVDRYVMARVDLDSDGQIEAAEVLPDANFLLGVIQRLDTEAKHLLSAIEAWQPTIEDAFTALLVMTPTMSEYFGQWKKSAAVSKGSATETAFVATSRLFDVVNILTGLRVTYDNLSPLVKSANPDLDAQIAAGFEDLQAYVGELYADEQSGVTFDPEEADLLGTEAQDRAEAIAALVAQAADELGIAVDLN